MPEMEENGRASHVLCKQFLQVLMRFVQFKMSSEEIFMAAVLEVVAVQRKERAVRILLGFSF